MNKFDKIALMIVPTGVGASIGGYAGDASTYAQKIAKVIPLIVNPNIVNAAVFSGITDNMFYVEGYAIEQFLKGNLGLLPSYNNKIGVVFDKAIPQNVLNVHLNTLNAVKTVYGIDLIGYEITDQKAGVEFYKNEVDEIQKFASTQDFKNNASINGKLLKDIWQDVKNARYMQCGE